MSSPPHHSFSHNSTDIFIKLGIHLKIIKAHVRITKIITAQVGDTNKSIRKITPRKAFIYINSLLMFITSSNNTWPHTIMYNYRNVLRCLSIHKKMTLFSLIAEKQKHSSVKIKVIMKGKYGHLFSFNSAIGTKRRDRSPELFPLALPILEHGSSRRSWCSFSTLLLISQSLFIFFSASSIPPWLLQSNFFLASFALFLTCFRLTSSPRSTLIYSSQFQ